MIGFTFNESASIQTSMRQVPKYRRKYTRLLACVAQAVTASARRVCCAADSTVYRGKTLFFTRHCRIFTGTNRIGWFITVSTCSMKIIHSLSSSELFSSPCPHLQKIDTSLTKRIVRLNTNCCYLQQYLSYYRTQNHVCVDVNIVNGLSYVLIQKCVRQRALRVNAYIKTGC